MQWINNNDDFLDYLYQHCHCVNARQTKEERRAKYRICRSLGDTVDQARRRMDWRTTNIARVHGYSNWQSLINNLGKLVK